MECCSDYRLSWGTSIVLLLLGKPNTMLTNELVALPSPINCQCRIDELLRLLRVKKNKLLIKFACRPWGIWGCILHSTVLCLACRRATLPEGCIACCLSEIVECPHLTLAWRPHPFPLCVNDESSSTSVLIYSHLAEKDQKARLNCFKAIALCCDCFVEKAQLWAINNSTVHLVCLC